MSDEVKVCGHSARFTTSLGKCLVCACTEMQAEIADLKRSWISVAERLPEDGQDVLAWFVDDNSSIGGDHIASVQVWEFSLNHQYFPRRNGARQGVTHWMPLPEPPKVKP